jgi:hypothetical protein
MKDEEFVLILESIHAPKENTMVYLCLLCVVVDLH